MSRVRIAAAQMNTVVGDLEGNASRIFDVYEAAAAAGADLVVFPELTITGYPPEDLLLRPAFVAQAAEALEKLAARTGATAAIVGFPEAGRDLSNAAAVLAHGRVQGVYRKHLLPNYAVFDEQRYFVPGDDYGPLFVIAGVRVSVSICEDAWSPTGPIAHQAAGGAELAVNLNASPYYAGRLHERETMLATRAADASIPATDRSAAQAPSASARDAPNRMRATSRAISGPRGPSPIATALIAVATVPPDRSSDATLSNVSGTTIAI